MTAKPVSRTSRYQALCRQAAKRLGCKPSDDRCSHYATLMLAKEATAARLIAGQNIDPTALLRLDEALRAFMPPAEPAKVEVEFVQTIQDMCPRCGFTHDSGKAVDEPDPPPAPPTPPTSPPPTETAKPSLPAPSAPNVVPIRRDGSVHDVAFPSGEVAPLKRYQNEPWRGHVLPNLNGGGSASNPFSAGPAPNFSAPVLPSPFDRGRS
jgi:hypothetical protein